MSKTSCYPLVWIVWVDSTFFEVPKSWTRCEDIQDEAKGPLPLCQSAGFLIHEDKYGVAIALSMNHNGGVADFIKIPNETIREIRKLKAGKLYRRKKR